jgi:3-oxoacyl-[acyl-carrier protein] reductase
MEIKLEGKGAIVTGASRGIGRAIALRLARSGADVAVNYHVNKAKAEEVCAEIRKMGRQSLTIQADVSSSSQVDMMVEKVAEVFDGRIDILVCNAGIKGSSLIKDVVKMTDEDWSRIIGTNLNGAFYASRAAAKKMIQKGAGGRIIGIASGAGHSGRLSEAAYCASKAGLMLLCKTLAIELAPYGINVNSISVGFVDVNGFGSPELKKFRESILPRILLRRAGRPEDIANMAAFLASEEAGWITGADFRVDGGESAGRVPEGNP